jgi:hypothetical protein
MRKIGLLAALVVTISSEAFSVEDLTQKDRRDIYRDCFPSCLKSQRALPSNQVLRDMPFLFDAYCSCACARQVLRMTKEQAVKIGELQGKANWERTLRSDSVFMATQEQAGAVCRTAIFGD